MAKTNYRNTIVLCSRSDCTKTDCPNYAKGHVKGKRHDFKYCIYHPDFEERNNAYRTK